MIPAWLTISALILTSILRGLGQLVYFTDRYQEVYLEANITDTVQSIHHLDKLLDPFVEIVSRLDKRILDHKTNCKWSSWTTKIGSGGSTGCSAMINESIIHRNPFNIAPKSK